VTAPALAAHQPVLLAEVLEGLRVRPGGDHLDGTLGGGGHAAAILLSSAPDGRLLGIDRDPSAIARARLRCAPHVGRFTFKHGSFGDMARIAADAGFAGFDGVLLDLGFSSDQVDDPLRGFSFASEGPLGMRLDPGADLTAADIVNGMDEHDLADLLYELGEERRSRRIARAIVAARPLSTTTELAAVVAGAVGGNRARRRIHPATRTFQALRIAVNDELGQLERALPQAVDLLRPGGRLAVISFHSLEDRIVKHFIKEAASACVCPPGVPECRCDHVATVSVVTRRPVRPTGREVNDNPRARSAKLRVAERLPAQDSDMEGHT